MFKQTHQTLEKSLKNLKNELKNSEFLAIIKQIESENTKTSKTIVRLHGECSSLYRSILSIQKSILGGKMNVKNHYEESDLKMISVINHIHYEYGKPSSYEEEIAPMTALEEINQMCKDLDNMIYSFPDDLGINVKKSPNIITNIKLDIYQMIYLFSVNARSLIHEIRLQKLIYKMVYLETVDL